ncbi:YbaL family putative K(+) efflux transporter [Rhodoligotrophos ferricapiens]|uniref:YbaL family putative K(+) efflux transporter n=1 Tax=Rhodoligotrophos ferricapiens TaxID=3069264 RepID=UPI00315C5BCC
MHHTPLITTLVGGLVLAFLLGALANRLRISPLVGYLVAGILAGPFTPGFVADLDMAMELAEIGVILLMFGVGLHFSFKDLMSVRAIAVPGALAQIAIATLLGVGLGLLMGWPIGAGVVFGLALSVASTVVLLRALQERRLVETERGRIAVGWLIVEDLAMVLTLVLLPALAGLLISLQGEDSGARATLSSRDVLETVAITLGKVAAFVALMLIVGRRAVPWLLHRIAHMGSRELFRLAVLAVSLGVAYGATTLFGVSFALGAFFAGMVLSESELSHRAAEETLPLRDAFAVLFFVSVGMLFDPSILIRDPLPVLATFLIIVLGKSVAAFAIMRAFGHPVPTALTISASLAQIGEFSFILAALGVSLNLLPQEGRDLILAGSILSILANPLFFAAIDRWGPLLEARIEGRKEAPAAAAPAQERAASDAEPPPPVTIGELPKTSLRDHAVLIGFGRVGSIIGEALIAQRVPLLVIEERDEPIAQLRDRGIEAINGNAAASDLIKAANLEQARWLIVAIPHSFEAGQIISQARLANPALHIVARSHSDAETNHLLGFGADRVIMGEREIADAMVNFVVRASGDAQIRGPFVSDDQPSEAMRKAAEADFDDDLEGDEAARDNAEMVTEGAGSPDTVSKPA